MGAEQKHPCPVVELSPSLFTEWTLTRVINSFPSMWTNACLDLTNFANIAIQDTSGIYECAIDLAIKDEVYRAQKRWYSVENSVFISMEQYSTSVWDCHIITSDALKWEGFIVQLRVHMHNLLTCNSRLSLGVALVRSSQYRNYQAWILHVIVFQLKGTGDRVKSKS